MTGIDEAVKEQLKSGTWRTCPEIARILAKENTRTSYYTTRQKVFRALYMMEKYRIVEKKKVANVVFWRLTPCT